MDLGTGKDYDRCAINVGVKGGLGLCAALVPSIVLLRGRGSRSFARGLGAGIGIGMALHENAVLTSSGKDVYT